MSTVFKLSVDLTNGRWLDNLKRSNWKHPDVKYHQSLVNVLVNRDNFRDNVTMLPFYLRAMLPFLLCKLKLAYQVTSQQTVPLFQDDKGKQTNILLIYEMSQLSLGYNCF